MRKKAVIFLAAAVLILGVLALLMRFKIVKPNVLLAGGYEVRGVDVARYQGEIDWGILSSQGIDFAFIKSTEGSTYTDPYFHSNMENALDTGLRVGAYHFFSFDSAGELQAEHYISAVGVNENMLPPVVDVELYGGYSDLSSDKIAEIKANLRRFIDILTAYYGKTPIIYTTNGVYGDLIKDDFDDCDLWIRNVYFKPSPSVEWTFWQYTDTAVLDGYAGEERCIDMSVFCGTKEEFSRYGG